MTDKSKKNDLIIFGLYIVLVNAFGAFLLFGAGAAENLQITISTIFYMILSISFGAGIGLFALASKNDKGLEEAKSVVHDPEESPFGGFKVVRSPVQLLIISLIIFGGIWSFFAVTVNTFAGTPAEISASTTILANIEPAVIAETSMITFFQLAITFLITRYIWVRRFKITGKKLASLSVITMIMAGIIAGFFIFPAYHNFVYGEDETKIVAVTAIGTGCGLMTAATFSIIPCYVFHAVNNGFAKSNELFSDEVNYLISGAILVSMIMLLLVVRRFQKEG